MTMLNEKLFELFPSWLNSLGTDVRLLSRAALTQDIDEDARRQLIGGLNYLFKSLDLIPDGIEDIGYLDDAFVLRLSARAALGSGAGAWSSEVKEGLERLAAGTSALEKFLEPGLYRRLEAYVRGLRTGSARGRSVDDILDDAGPRGEFDADVRAFAADYQPPSFQRDEKNLVKLRAFFEAKLPKE